MAGEVISELRRKAFVEFRTKRPKDIIERLPKMLQKANEAKNLKKYEEAYIYCCRYLACVEWITNMKKTDKKYDHTYNTKMISEKDVEYAKKELRFLNNVITEKVKAEEKANNISNSVQKMQIDNDLTSLLPDTPTEELISFELENISCIELYDLVNNNSKRTLIIDIRPVSEFEKCTLSAPKCINIPPEEIQKGKSSSSIITYLKSRDPKMLKLYQYRDKNHIDTIVIVDEYSHKSSNVIQLFEIFRDWDIGGKFGKIVALEGGFHNWNHTYPIHVTNPMNTIESNEKINNSMNDIINSIDYDFISLVDEPKPVINYNKHNHLESTKTKLPVKPITKIHNESMKISTLDKRNVSFPPEANKTVNVPKPPINRSNKPTVTKIEKQPLIDATQKMIKCSEELCELKQEIFEYQEKKLTGGYDLHRVQTDKELTRLMEKERAVTLELEALKKIVEVLNNSKHPTQDSNLSSKMFQLELRYANAKRNIKHIDDKIYQQIQNASQKEEKKVKISEDIHKEPLKPEGFYSNSGLKRSHSSPNLAQMNEGSVPRVDRSLKPHLNHKNETISNHRYSSMSVSERENRMEPVNRTSNYPGITGLKNLGNSCYMNSIIQCLSNTATLAKYFNEDAYHDDLNDRNKNGGQVAEEVAQVIKALWNGHYKSITPRDLKNVIGQYKLQFESYDQQDSHEFLIFLLDWMHNDLKKEAPRKEMYLTNAEKEWDKATFNQSSVISKLFFGQLRSTVCCSTCENNSTTYQIFNSLTMSLSHSSKCTLDDCIKRYVSGQKITDWKCPHCKVPRDATKKFDFVKLSPIIVIHFNRFGESDGWLEKKNTVVDFPLTDFNLEQYVARDEVSNNNNRQYSYNLYAMSNHSGTMEGGHYTAYCKNANQDKWYKYDDHTVTEVPKSQVKSQTTSAYLLFYSSLPDRDIPIHRIDT